MRKCVEICSKFQKFILLQMQIRLEKTQRNTFTVQLTSAAEFMHGDCISSSNTFATKDYNKVLFRQANFVYALPKKTSLIWNKKVQAVPIDYRGDLPRAISPVSEDGLYTTFWRPSLFASGNIDAVQFKTGIRKSILRKAYSTRHAVRVHNVPFVRTVQYLPEGVFEVTWTPTYESYPILSIK